MNGHVSATNAVSARLIGAIFLERGLVTQEQLQAALAIQVESKEHLGEILVQHFGVSRIELASVLAEQWADLERANAGSAGPGGDASPGATSPQLRVVDEASGQQPEPEPQRAAAVSDEDDSAQPRRPLGEILAEQGLVTDAELDRALETQRQGGEKLGEILVGQGSITRLQLASALADQWTALRKIRPPSTSEIQPSVAAHPPVVKETSSADVDRLHEAVSALEQRLRAAESVAAREPWREEIKTATDGIQASVTEIESKVAAAATREELEAVEGIRAALDELTSRVEEISSPERDDDPELVRRVEAAAEAASAARSSLDGAFESLSLRLADVESRVHDRSDFTRLQQQLADLAQRVSELGGEHGDSELEELRNEVQRLMHEVSRRTTASSEPDPALANRVEKLTLRVEEIGTALKGVDGGKKSKVDDALREAMAAIAARVEKLEAGDTTSLQDIRNSLAELQARVPIDSPLADRLSRYGSGPDEINALTERLDEIEGQATELAERAPVVDEHLGALTDRIGALEGSSVGDDLVALKDSVEQLAGRPVPDPELSGRVDELSRKLAETAVATTEIGELRASVEALASKSGAVGAISAEVDAVRSQLVRFDELAGRLSTLESDSGALEDLRTSIAALAARPVADPNLVAQLHARVEEVSAVVRELGDLRGGLSALGSRLDTVAERAEAAVPVDEMRALAGRLEGLESTSHADEIAALQRTVAELASRPAGDPAVAARVEQLAHDLEVSPDVSPQLEVLGARVGELARQAGAAGRVAEQVEELRSRLDSLSQLDVRVDALEGTSAAIEGMRTRVDELADRPVADSAQVDQIARRVEELSGLSGQMDGLRSRLDTVVSQVSTPSEDVVEFRREVDSLAQRIESFGLRGPETAPTAAVEALIARVEELERSAQEQGQGSELADLREKVEQLASRPADDPALADRVEELASALEEIASTKSQLKKLRGRLDAATDDRELATLRKKVEQLASRPTEDPALAAALEEITSTRSQLEELRDRLDAANDDNEVAALREKVEQLASRPADDPALAGRVEQLAGAFEEIASTKSQLEELRGRLDAASDNPEIATLREKVEQLASRPADDPALAGRVEQLAGAFEEIASTKSQLEELRGRLDAASDNPEIATLREKVEQLASRPADDPALAGRVDELAGAFEEIASTKSQLEELRGRLDAVQEAKPADPLAELGPRLDALEHRLAEGESRDSGVEARVDELSSRLGAVDELPARLDAIGEQLAAQGSAQAEHVNATELTGLRDEVAEQLASVGRRLTEFGEDRRKGLKSLEARIDEIVAALGAEAREQRGEIVARVARVEDEAEKRRSEIAELRASADLDQVRSELNALAARVDGGDVALSAARDALAAELEARFDAEATRNADKIRATEEALQAGLSSLGERLTETEATYAEAGDSLRQSIERLGEAIADEAEEAPADVVPAAPDSPNGSVELYVEGPLLAFVPNGDGYSLHELNGVAPVVGEPVLFPDRDGEFVVTRIGRSPLPRDGRRCAYLELRPAPLAAPDRVP